MTLTMPLNAKPMPTPIIYGVKFIIYYWIIYYLFSYEKICKPAGETKILFTIWTNENTLRAWVGAVAYSTSVRTPLSAKSSLDPITESERPIQKFLLIGNIVFIPMPIAFNVL